MAQYTYMLKPHVGKNVKSSRSVGKAYLWIFLE